MAKELKHLDITSKPELLQVVEEVQSGDEPLVLSKGGDDVAILRPVKRSTKRVRRGKVLTTEDPLFSLVGIGQSSVPGGVSGKKHAYLLQAYRKQHK
ncbi:MAG: hypothetical protein HY675_21975 [Chloroflexi bacterium]|nr:hypothetical protein [Chloroflexota bacterium]